jgi:hypothetical protein
MFSERILWRTDRKTSFPGPVIEDVGLRGPCNHDDEIVDVA